MPLGIALVQFALVQFALVQITKAAQAAAKPP